MQAIVTLKATVKESPPGESTRAVLTNKLLRVLVNFDENREPRQNAQAYQLYAMADQAISGDCLGQADLLEAMNDVVKRYILKTREKADTNHITIKHVITDIDFEMKSKKKLTHELRHATFHCFLYPLQ